MDWTGIAALVAAFGGGGALAGVINAIFKGLRDRQRALGAPDAAAEAAFYAEQLAANRQVLIATRELYIAGGGKPSDLPPMPPIVTFSRPLEEA